MSSINPSNIVTINALKILKLGKYIIFNFHSKPISINIALYVVIYLQLIHLLPTFTILLATIHVHDFYFFNEYLIEWIWIYD